MEPTALLQPFTLLLARLTPLFLATNMSPMQYFPAMVRLILLLILSYSLTLLSFSQWQVLTQGYWMLGLMYEFGLGLVLLLSVQLALAAIQILGRVLDMQVGFAAAGIVDPNSQNNEPLLGYIIILFFTLAFFLTNTHHLVLAGLHEMVMVLPPGSWDGDFSIHKIMSYFGAQLTFAMLLIGPVVMGLWLLDLFGGFISKTMPQMNVYFVLLPLKIWVGLFLLSVSVTQFKPLLGSMYQAMLQWFAFGWIR